MKRFQLIIIVALIAIVFAGVIGAIVGAGQSPEALTGNWVVRTDNKDGTFRTTYLNLKQDGENITGTIRVTQFLYRISESKSGDDGRIVLTRSMMDGKNERKVQYEIKLNGHELQVWTRRRPQDPSTQLIAVRAPAGEGAMPARNPVPALHKLGKQGRRAWQSDEQEVWTRSLSGGGWAIAFFNREKDAVPISVKPADLKITVSGKHATFGRIKM